MYFLTLKKLGKQEKINFWPLITYADTLELNYKGI